MRTVYHDRTDVDVVVDVPWSVNDHWPVEPTGILRRVVRVVPRRAVEIGSELVCEALAGGDRALGQPRHAIHPRRSVLEKPVPVDCSAFGRIICDEIVDLDFYPIPPVSLD